MNITNLTVSLKRTQSLPGYCNVSSGTTMTADLSDGDDPVVAEQRLRSELEQSINEWIDAELEKAGQPARYSPEPRYDLVYWRNAKLYFIVPHLHDFDFANFPGTWFVYSDSTDAVYRNQRLANLRRMVGARVLIYYEMETVNELFAWPYHHLSKPTTWSFVRIYAADPHPTEHDYGWLYLGHIGVWGNVYAELVSYTGLKIELEHRSGSVAAVGELDGYDEMPIRTPEEAYQWIDARITEVIRELYPEEAAADA